MKVRKKIILTGFTILLLLITTVSTTFAWFSLNDTAWVDDFEIEIHNSDKLLVKHSGGNYKQMLSNDDIVLAINQSRLDNPITKLSDIRFSEVYSTDGINFHKMVSHYDSLNKKTISFEKADLNSYLDFTLTFKIEEGNLNEGTSKPTYQLKFVTDDTDEGLKKTSFSSENQTINLLNDLICKEQSYSYGDSLTVNPVNALRMAVKSDSNIDYIYEITDEYDLGGYAMCEDVLDDLEITDTRHFSSQNAAFTYFNNVNGDILSPLGYLASEEEVIEYGKMLGKLKYNFFDSLGEFKFNQETNSYNEISLSIRIWLEGFDADNLIGLDASVIKCLLSFTIEEGGIASE